MTKKFFEGGCFEPKDALQVIISIILMLLQTLLKLQTGKKDKQTVNNYETINNSYPTTNNYQINQTNSDFQNILNEIHISIESAKQEQKKQQQQLDVLARQISQTKDKNEHAQLLNELQTQKANFENGKRAITKISHAVKRGDYEEAAQEAGIFAQNGTLVYESPSDKIQVDPNMLNPTSKTLDRITLTPLGGEEAQIRRYVSPESNVSSQNIYQSQPLKDVSFPRFNLRQNQLTDTIAKEMNRRQMPEETKHSRAETYKQLCLISDKIALSSLRQNVEGMEVADGYQVIKAEYDTKTNFKAVSYMKGNEIVNCFVGTDAKSSKDHRANVQMGMRKVSEQMNKANKYTEGIVKTYKQTHKIINAGHSEGGSEAMFAGLNNNLEVFTYNTFALSGKTLARIEQDKGVLNHNLISNYRDPHDPISKLLYRDIGKTYVVENQQSKFMAKSPFGLKQAHALAMMGDCNTAVDIRLYKLQNPWFIDKISTVKLTNKNIEDIYKAGLFDIYEPEIAERLKIHDIIPEQQAQSLVRQGILQYLDGHYEYLTQ